MKRSSYTRAHIAFWLFGVFLVMLVLGIMTSNNVVSNDQSFYYFGIFIGLLVTPALFSFYTFYIFLFPRYLQKRKLFETITYGVLLAFLSSLIGCFVLYLLIDINYTCLQQSNYVALLIMTIIGVIFGSIALVLKGFLTWYEEIKLKEALLDKNHEMEIALVKSQLDPHFLFNTINNIDVLILKDVKEASKYLNKLSDIMRFMLYETKPDKIPLEKEIHYIEKYIELQKIRTSNANYVNYSVIGDVRNKKIAPMVFIPFIENAFKHTNNKKFENAITIKINIEDTQMTLKCINKFDPTRQMKGSSNGLGNDLIIKRLNLIYPNQHELIVTKSENEYSIYLSIQIEKI